MRSTPRRQVGFVVRRPESDYKGFFGFGGKIWLTEMPEIQPGLYLLVAGAGRASVDALADGRNVQRLPPELDYTAMIRIGVGQ